MPREGDADSACVSAEGPCTYSLKGRAVPQALSIAIPGSERVSCWVAKELGADEAVDYTKQKFEEVYKDAPFDCVVDLVGGGQAYRHPGLWRVVAHVWEVN